MDADDDSNDTPKTTRSPVLDSSTFKRKFLKRKHSGKNAKIRLSKRFENEINNANISPSCIDDENIQTNTFSKFHQELMNNKTEWPIEDCRYDSKSLLNDKHDVGFKTASGKPLFTELKSSDFANTLMSDFYNPLIASKRENKHSFLSKSFIGLNFKSNSLEYTDSTECFLGFKHEEYDHSLQIYENFQRLINALSSERIPNYKKNDIFHTETLHNCKKDSSISEKSDIPTSKEIVQSDSVDNGLFDFSESIFMKIEETSRTSESPKKSDMKLSKNSLIHSEQIDECNVNKASSREKKNSNHIIGIASNPNIDAQDRDIKYINKFLKIENTSGLDIMEKTEEKQSTPQLTTESGHKINICPSSINKIEGLSEDFLPNEKKVATTVKAYCDTDKQSNSEQESSVTKIETKYADYRIPQFSTASGKKINITSEKLSNIHNIFKDITDLKVSDYTMNVLESPKHTEENVFLKKHNRNFPDNDHQSLIRDEFNENFSSTDEVKIQSRSNSLKCSEKVVSLFSTASGKNIKLPFSTLLGIDKVFKDIPEYKNINFKEDQLNCDKNGEFKTINGFKLVNTPSISPPLINKYNPQIFSLKNNINVEHSSSGKISNFISEENRHIDIQSGSINQLDTPSKIINSKEEINYITPQRNQPRKKRLGGYLSRDGKISNSALNKAKTLFGDMNFDDLKLPPHLTVQSPKISQVELSTPMRSKRFNVPQHTPNKFIKKNEYFMHDTHQDINHPFIIQKPTPGNLTDLENELNKQKKLLETKLEIVMKRQEAIRTQIHAQSSNRKFKYVDYSIIVRFMLTEFVAKFQSIE